MTSGVINEDDVNDISPNTSERPYREDSRPLNFRVLTICGRANGEISRPICLRKDFKHRPPVYRRFPDDEPPAKPCAGGQRVQRYPVAQLED
jgi:hypothetical protein